MGEAPKYLPFARRVTLRSTPVALGGRPLWNRMMWLCSKEGTPGKYKKLRAVQPGKPPARN